LNPDTPTTGIDSAVHWSGFDWAYDDANGQGFNGSTSVYTGNDRGGRKIITITASELVY